MDVKDQLKAVNAWSNKEQIGKLLFQLRMTTELNQIDQRAFSSMSMSFSEESVLSLSSESVNDILDEVDYDPEHLDSALSFIEVE